MSKKHNDPPAAMLDADGKLLTSKIEIKGRAFEVYSQRLDGIGKKIEAQLEDYEKDVAKLCESRLRMWKLKRVNPWTMDNLILAIKDLYKGNSRDALGYAN